METLYRVNFREDGKWEVFKKGNQRATRVFDTQEKAIEFATDLTNQETVVEIAKKDETIGYAKDVTSQEVDEVIVQEQEEKPSTPVEEVEQIEEILETPRTRNAPPIQLEPDVKTNPTISPQPKKKRGFLSRLFGKR
jgi:hypothetical protein